MRKYNNSCSEREMTADDAPKIIIKITALIESNMFQVYVTNPRQTKFLTVKHF